MSENKSVCEHIDFSDEGKCTLGDGCLCDKTDQIGPAETEILICELCKSEWDISNNAPCPGCGAQIAKRHSSTHSKEKEEAAIPEEMMKWIREKENCFEIGSPEQFGCRQGLVAMYHKLMEDNTEAYWFQKAREVLVERNDFKGQLSSMKGELDKANHDLGVWVGNDSRRERELENMTAELRIARGNEESYRKWGEETAAERDAALKEVGELQKIHQEIDERHTYLRAEENKAINELDGNAPGSIERQAKWTFIREMCGRRNELWAWLNKLPAHKKEEHP